MRVICSTTEYYIDENGNPSSHISVRKGSVYNVINVINVIDSNEFKNEFILKHKRPPAEGKWYKLLEVNGFHHESKFVELPDYLFEENVETKEKINTI